jgi:putative DNA primase/helicase
MSLDARTMRRLGLTERARRADILTLAQRFSALKRVGASEWVGPCPVCGGTDRFSVNIKKQLWNCRGCGKGGDAIGLAQHAGGATFAEAVAALSGETWASFNPSPPERDPDDEDDDVRSRRKTARWLWSQRKALAGSIAETYLRKARGYAGPLPATVGFLRPFKGYPPSLIAAFAMPDEAEPGVLRAPFDVAAVQLIALKADGSDKAAVEIQKRTIGSPKGVPIVVAPADDLLAISIHEGIEDALSAHAAAGLGAWASGGAPFLANLADAVPSYVETVTVVAHRDEAGRIGARELARRLAARGFKVLLHGGV